jgi:hypothetical protein
VVNLLLSADLPGCESLANQAGIWRSSAVGALSQTIELGVPASLPPRLLVNDSELKYLSTGLWN